jgi:hypothetical protein
MMMTRGNEMPNEWGVRFQAALARLGVAPAAQLILSRKDTLRVGFDLADVAEKDREAAIALKLLRYLGESPAGYAWKSQGSRTDVWYWKMAAPAGYRYAPEQLFRTALPAGISLVRCAVGFELCEVKDAQLLGSRWFSDVPNEAQIQDFASDPSKTAGLTVKPVVVGVSRGMSAGWKLGNNAVKSPVGGASQDRLPLLPALGVFIACAALTFLATDYWMTLKRIETATAENAQLKKSASAAVEVRTELDQVQASLAPLRQAQPKFSQLGTMARVAKSGVASELADVRMAEWEYRSGKLRMVLTLGPRSKRMEDVVQAIEGSKILKNLRITPGSTPAALIVQGDLVDMSQLAPLAMPTRPEINRLFPAMASVRSSTASQLPTAPASPLPLKAPQIAPGSVGRPSGVRQ